MSVTWPLVLLNDRLSVEENHHSRVSWVEEDFVHPQFFVDPGGFVSLQDVSVMCTKHVIAVSPGKFHLEVGPPEGTLLLSPHGPIGVCLEACTRGTPTPHPRTFRSSAPRAAALREKGSRQGESPMTPASQERKAGLGE